MFEKITAAEWLGGGALTVIGAVAGKLVDGVFKREADREKAPADTLRAMADYDRAVSAGGAELVDHFRKEFKFLREQLSAADGKFADLRAEQDALKAEHSKCEATVEGLRGEIARMMAAAPPASY